MAIILVTTLLLQMLADSGPYLRRGRAESLHRVLQAVPAVRVQDVGRAGLDDHAAAPQQPDLHADAGAPQTPDPRHESEHPAPGTRHPRHCCTSDLRKQRGGCWRGLGACCSSSLSELRVGVLERYLCGMEKQFVKFRISTHNFTPFKLKTEISG